MLAGIAAVAMAGLLMRRKLWDKAVVVLLLLGAGVLAKSWKNPVSGFSGQFVALIAFVMLVAIVIDLMTKRIEKITYGLAFFFPFFGLAAGGLIGSLCDTIFNLGLWNQFYTQVT